MGWLFRPVFVGLGATLLLLSACGSGARSSDTVHKRTSGIQGYSIPNSWHLNGTALSDALCANGLTGTEIEWVPYIGSPVISKGSTSAVYPTQALALIEQNRECGITTMISIANMNGCATQREPDSWFQAQLDYITGTIGPELVMLSPVSEPEMFEPQGKSLRWARLARYNGWQGLFVLPDIGRTRPFWPGLPFDYIDVHYCKLSDLQTGLAQRDPRFIRNTDCGTLVNPGPVVAAELMRQSLDTGSTLLIYDFSAPVPDLATITAMGNEIK